MGWRLSLVIALLSVIVFVTVPALVDFRPADPPIDDGDLRIARIPVAELSDESNGMMQLHALGARLVWPADGDDAIAALLEAEPLDVARAAAFLEPHDALLEESAAIARLERFQLPAGALDGDPAGAPGAPELSDAPKALAIGTPFLRIARCLALRARLRSASGDGAGALADLELALELGRRVRTARGTDLVTGVIGMAAAKPALEALPGVAARLELDAAATLAATRRFAAARTTPESWRAIWQGEYETMARTMDEIAVGAAAAPGDVISEYAEELPTTTYYFQPNATKGLYADYYRAVQAGSGVPCDELELPEVETPTQPLMFLGIFAGANAVGEILFSIGAIDVKRYEGRRCDYDTQVAAGQVLLALHAYRRQHGAWPKALEELVPSFLDAVPRDGTSGRPLYYDTQHSALGTIQAVDGETRVWQLAD